MADNADNIALEFIFTQKVGLFLGKQPWPVQGIPFRFGLRATNVGQQPFPGATIGSLGITHKESGLRIFSSNQVAISLLNPEQSVDIWADEAVSELQGAMWLSCDVKASDTTRAVTTFQRYAGKQNVPFEHANAWGNIIYVQPKLELLQARTNLLVFALTIIVTIDSIIGLRVIVNFIFALLAELFTGIASLLNTLIR